MNDRFRTEAFTALRAEEVLKELLPVHAEEIVLVRAQGNEMIVVVGRDEGKKSVARNVLRAVGFDLKRGGIGIVGLRGVDVPRLLEGLSTEQTEWLLAPSGARETKVLLASAGVALLSIDIHDGMSVVAHYVLT